MNIEVKSLVSGLMAYWDEVPEATRYFVHLLIGYTSEEGKTTYQEIAVVEVPRNIKYHSFLNLAEFRNDGAPRSNYYIYVEAEDRTGNIIAKTDKRRGIVYVMREGYYSLIY